MLTEGRRFKGSLADLEAVKARVSVPVLRKDFIATPYQVLEARASGADLVLLIVAALEEPLLRELYALVTDLGMTPLVETHSREELDRASDLGARLIGVNARNLSTFELDKDLFGSLAEHFPADAVKIAESAVLAPGRRRALPRRQRRTPVLVGEALVTSDPVTTLHAFLEAGKVTTTSLRDQHGPFFGDFGGRYMPESLIAAIDELTAEYEAAKADPAFQAEFESLLHSYAGRPSALTEVPRFAEHAGGARVFLKREDLNHTGSHKINNVIGQALLTKRLGKTRVIAETGAGQHGVATATAAALFGFDCTIYMGEVDTERQALNVARMRLLGAEVVPVTSGSRTLKDAINEAYRDWVASVETTNYIFGTAAGPHPFPAMVRDFQKIISEEARAQLLEETGRLPDAVVACVGGGSNAIGMFDAFLDDEAVALYGVEAAGDGVDTDKHAASIERGRPGVLHGAKTYVLQDEDGQTVESHSISAGLDYPGVGPEHAWLADIGRASYIPATDAEAMDALRLLSRTEGIIPAIESAHALAGALRLGRELGPDAIIAVSLSGRGDKDMDTAATWFGLYDKGERPVQTPPDDERASGEGIEL